MLKTHVQEGQKDAVRLRVRTDTGKQILLNLSSTDIMATVYSYIRPYVDGKLFELSTNFPKKPYAETLAGSLKELGLAPSCVFIVKLV